MHAHTHWEQHRACPCPFPLPFSHLPPFSPLNPSLSLRLSLSPLELSPLFLPALPLSTSTPLSSCENSVCVCVCVCVWTPCACVLRRVLWVCIGLCVFLSGAGVQPFISGADCRLGNTQISLRRFLTHAPAAFWTFFFLRLTGLIRFKVGLCHCSLLPSRHYSHPRNYSRSFSQLSENNFSRDFYLPRI